MKVIVPKIPGIKIIKKLISYPLLFIYIVIVITLALTCNHVVLVLTYTMYKYTQDIYAVFSYFTSQRNTW